MQSKKKLIIGICVSAVILIAVLGIALLPGREEALFAMSAAQRGQAREKTYQS